MTGGIISREPNIGQINAINAVEVDSAAKVADAAGFIAIEHCTVDVDVGDTGAKVRGSTNTEIAEAFVVVELDVTKARTVRYVD